MKKLFYLLLFLLSQNTIAQSEASNWYFGNGAGIQFNQDLGTVTNDFGSIDTFEGCASISDEDGNLLFSTDGIKVYGSNHQLMPNGDDLYGDPSSSQSAIIIPKPDHPNIYYVFTVGTLNNTEGNPNLGLNYSEVDMTLNNGLGDVTVKNVNLLRYCSEKISAVSKDCTTNSIWVVALASRSRLTTTGNGLDTFHAFEVTNQGVNPESVRTRFINPNVLDPRGYLKLSPDGSKLASANITEGLFLYDFDKETGELSNEQELLIYSANDSPYGIEFSPNSQFLYVHAYNNVNVQGEDDVPENHFSSLVQYDLSVPSIEINETQVTIDERQLYRGALQLGPDGRIYRALSATYNEGLPHLGVIKNPNLAGLACNYTHNAVDLEIAQSTQGLPPFISSFFYTQIDIIRNGISDINLSLCSNDTYTLIGEDIPGATYTWSLDDIPLAENDFDLDITQGGHYKLLIDPNNGECLIEGEAFVAYFDTPVANQPNNIEVCDNDNDSIYSFDLTSQDDSILGIQDAMIYNVHYFESQQDAIDNVNEINGLYNNISNPQEIFVRIDLERNTDCYDTTSFFIEVFNTPIANLISDFSICENDINNTDGQTNIDLSSLNLTVLNGQNSLNNTITYHSSQDDASNGVNPLPYNYFNVTPFEETIFVRIENNLKTDCFNTTSFTVTINPIPQVFDASLIQCDEDGDSDGITVFNLNQVSNTISGNEPDKTVIYYLSYNDANNNINPINSSYYTNVSNPQTIYTRVVDNLTGCISSNISELTLEVSTTSVRDISIVICDDDGVSDGTYNFNLNDISVDILNNLPLNLGLVFYETYENALLEVNPLATNFTNTTPYNQTIYARVENANACFGISEVQLTVLELPNIETEHQTIYCLNTFPELLTLTGGIIDDLPSNYYYNWSTGETTSEILINQPGTYTVRVTNTDGCFKDRTITVLPSNIATFTNIEVTDASSNNTITVFVTGEGIYQYAIDNPNGPYQDSNLFENVSYGFHTIYVRDIKNDCGTVDTQVSVIGFPKFFTPNGDDVNEHWQVKGISSQFQPNTDIFIFDRFGKLIAQLDPLGAGWDGTLNGYPLPANDYWFAVTLQDGRIFKSHFALKR
ncbi:T9SS type B sorting domain-containing protein [Ichthyenterobacterium magnum]|uniref:Gliding motility-associated-like protein n=1 Tax=Ichthyenterobacterium magnum TaxID=1230530 RepID=A0A420DH17_9FLAO|nr:T9SS type B sorting domain-containing protein [Ichthyenterobacterium magnum]RKE92378.1 gliding motility-associated-like protein [Ichthyenterobacterium magnum]